MSIASSLHPRSRPAAAALLAVLLAGGSLAAVYAAANDSSATQTGRPIPLLWKVSDADNSVYLLGSFHLLKAEDYPLSIDVDTAFADAESVVFEIAPQEMTSVDLGMRFEQAARRGDGTTLGSEISPATARKLRTWFQDTFGSGTASKLAAQKLQAYEPWFVALTISVTEMTRAGLDPTLGLDRHFADEAERAGKPTSGFETGEQQIAFLDGMGRQEQLQFLEETLDEAAQGGGQVEKLHQAWRSGDADEMWNGMAFEMRRDYPQLYQHINVDRNDAWLPRIRERLDTPGDDDTLVVVGSLHLLGSDGLVEKLRAKGYKVERICSACTP